MPLSPFDIRGLLVETGSPQLGDTSQHIGPRPDLLQAISQLLGAVGLVQANLLIHMTNSPDSVRVGGEVTYRLRVRNLGPEDATGVIITDTLPDKVNFVSASSGCSRSGKTVICEIGDMRDGETAVRLIRVRPTAPGKLSNTATVTGKEPDPRPHNNAATTESTVR